MNWKDPRFNARVEVLEYGSTAYWRLSEYEGLYVPVKIKCPICDLISTAIPFDCSDKGNVRVVVPLTTECSSCGHDLIAFVYLYESEIVHCDTARRFFSLEELVNEEKEKR